VPPKSVVGVPYANFSHVRCRPKAAPEVGES
jgi:hypothetical protein